LAGLIVDAVRIKVGPAVSGVETGAAHDLSEAGGGSLRLDCRGRKERRTDAGCVPRSGSVSSGLIVISGGHMDSLHQRCRPEAFVAAEALVRTRGRRSGLQHQLGLKTARSCPAGGTRLMADTGVAVRDWLASAAPGGRGILRYCW
jgi:hypothetical protein